MFPENLLEQAHVTGYAKFILNSPLLVTSQYHQRLWIVRGDPKSKLLHE